MTIVRYVSWRNHIYSISDDDVALCWMRTTLGLLLSSALVWGLGMAWFIHFNDPLQTPFVVTRAMGSSLDPFGSHTAARSIYGATPNQLSADSIKALLPVTFKAPLRVAD